MQAKTTLNDCDEWGYKLMLFVRRLVYRQGTGTCNVTMFLGHKGAEKPQECQQPLGEWISWGKTSSAVAKLLSVMGELGSLPELPQLDVPLGVL